MRISDWSSDVCSSDLLALVGTEEDHVAIFGAAAFEHAGQRGIVQILDDRRLQTITALGLVFDDDVRESACTIDLDEFGVLVDVAARSEEHTSELQSLMRISYAVFCLKTKKIYNTHHNTHITTTTV